MSACERLIQQAAADANLHGRPWYLVQSNKTHRMRTTGEPRPTDQVLERFWPVRPEKAEVAE